MNALLTIARSVLADAGRRKVVWVVLVFSAVLAFAVPSLPSYGQGVVGAVFREVTLSLMFAAAVVVALALSATRIPGELERRTVFCLLARDVRRWHYVVGTWLGMFAVIGAVLLAFTIVSILVGYLTYSEIMLQLFAGSFAIWLEMGALMALAVLMSTRFGVMTSIVGALAFLFIGHSINGLVAPGGGAGPVWWLPSLEIFNVISPVAHGGGYGLVYASAMVVAFVAWSAALLAGASASFGGRDL